MSHHGPTQLGTHLDRPVSVEMRDQQLVVVKRYLNGSASEMFEMMDRLWQSPFGERRMPPGVPEPLGVNGDELIMEHIDGSPLGTNSTSWSGTHADELATLIADLNCCNAVVDRARGGASLMRSLQRKHVAIATTCTSSALLVEFDAALQAIGTVVPTSEPMMLSHGDCSPRNVLVSSNGLRFIDVDRVQMAGPGRDIGYLASWVWVTTLLLGRQPTWTPGNEVLERYCLAVSDDAKASMIIDSARRTIAFHRAAALLRIAHGWSAMAARPDLAIEVCVEAHRVVSAQR